MPKALITGTSSGLGRALAETLIAQDWQVYGCSRRENDLPGLRHQVVDLSEFAQVPAALQALLQDVDDLELVVLNAGVLGEIRDLSATPMEDAKQVMEINLWSNKVVLDWLHARQMPIAQLVMISSGASVLGNRGWGGYALSKAALNMLAKLYAHEFPHTHLCALAPGIIDTAIMDYLCEQADAESYPALRRLQQARDNNTLPTAANAASQVLQVLPALRDQPSGSFIDIRAILDPQAYAALYPGQS